MTEHDAPGQDEDVARRAQLTTWFTGLLALAIAFATLFRPLFAEHDPIFTAAGVFNASITGAAWWWFRSGRVQHLAPSLLMALATAMAIPLMLISGGPNSQFTSLVPLFPIFGVLLSGRRLAVVTLVFWVLVLPMTYFAAGHIPDMTGEPWDPDKAASRTFWLILSSFLAMAFAIEFDRRTRELQIGLRAQAERDPLTGVANRRVMDDTLRRELVPRSNRWLTVMMIDVDYFKRYNDARGHAEGDEALKLIAGALQGQVRGGRDLLARYGGEEFIALLWDTDAEAAAAVGRRVRQAVRDLQLCFHEHDERVLTVTVGFASTVGADPAEAEELLRRADAALYHGKLSGRDCVVDGAQLGPEALVAQERGLEQGLRRSQ